MAISLSKGQKVDLTKGNPSLKKVVARLMWNVNSFDTGGDFDLDAAAFMLGSNKKCPSDKEFVFYNNAQHHTGSVIYSGDDRKGGKGEIIEVDLSKLPADIEAIAFSITIDQAEARQQNFGMVSGASIQLEDENGNQLCTYDLSEDFSIETAVVAGELYKHGADWKFNAIGQGWQGGLTALCNNYGLEVA